MKKIVSLLLMLMITVTGIMAGNNEVRAEELVQDVALSEVWTDDDLVGYSQSQTRGVYLLQGFSVINDAGGGKIGCGGITEAAVKCKVSVLAVLERKVNGSWTRVTSWTNTKTSAYSVSVSNTVSVASGYYYRIRSTHYAATDTSSSYTEGFWM